MCTTYDAKNAQKKKLRQDMTFPFCASCVIVSDNAQNNKAATVMGTSGCRQSSVMISSQGLIHVWSGPTNETARAVGRLVRLARH
jgi:hypothetical protein